MEGNLVIVESPAKAGKIQKFLGDGFTVKSSFGHIRDLQDKKLSIDIDHGFEPEYVISSDKQKVVADLKAAAAKADTVWLASDEDREGEAIAWHLATTLGLDPAKTKRIVFHEITKPAILEAVKNPRTIDMNLVNAQQARRVLDRLVGFELSPLLWRKIQRGLSAGRVQSVALRLVVDREKEIMNFESTPYYRIDGFFDIIGHKVKGTLENRFDSTGQARKFLEDSIGAKYDIRSVESKEALRNPAPPFTTSTLQQEASRKLHFPVSVTMRVAQSLYEKGFITYMRTDSTNLSSLAINTTKQLICDNFGSEYSQVRQFKTRSKGAQEAHEAIRPTFINDTDIQGTAQEKKLYSLIWNRTVASQMASAKVLNTTIKIGLDKRSELYAIQGCRILFDGFLKLYQEGTDDDSQDEYSQLINLPEVKVGTSAFADRVEAVCKYSQPPFRYSEATLVKKLEELGIGRPSTYAPTINTLTSERGYIVRGDKEGTVKEVMNLCLKGSVISEEKKKEKVGAEKSKLLPQEIGIIVTDYLVDNFKDVLDYDFTANVEKEFDKIAEGKTAWNAQISRFYAPFHTKVESAAGERRPEHTQKEIGIDPSDGRMITARFGPYGAYVQKGEGETKQFANLNKGQLIENLTLEDAIKLFQLPRTVGEYEGVPVVAMKGRFGPYLKYGDRNVPVPRGKDPLKISLNDCIELLGQTQGSAASSVLKEFTASGISIMNGRYGPYLKQGGQNYRLPKNCNASALTEEDCKKIIAEGTPTAKGKKFYRKKS